MRRRRLRRSEIAAFDLNLAPLVDVLMCLLVFFLLATRLVERRERPIRLPHARGAVVQSSRTATARITIDAEPRGARDVSYRIDGDPVARDELSARLRERARSFDRPACRIRAARDLPYEHVAPILRACAETRIADLTFAVDPAGATP